MMEPSTVPLHLEQNTKALEIGIFIYARKEMKQRKSKIKILLFIISSL